MEEKLKVIGKRIHELRIERGYSQAKLGNLLAVSQDTISLWETSKSIPTAEAIIIMAKIFETTCDYLLGVSDY